MSEESTSAPVTGSCTQCGCPLGYAASKKDGAWYCCGACSGSDRCRCGCKPEYTSEQVGDVFVPTRRMFAARTADGLKRENHDDDRDRSFPFSDKERGR